MYTFTSSYSGSQPIEGVSKTQQVPYGTMVSALDPVWGGGEFIYGKAGAAIRPGALCILNITFNATLDEYTFSFSEATNVLNSGFQIFVNIGEAKATDEFGWFAMSGFTPLFCNALLTSGVPVGQVAGGQAGVPIAGRQLLGIRVHQGGTQALVKPLCRGKPNDDIIQFRDWGGLFVGGYLSGAGVGTGAQITALDSTNGTARVSVANTAAGVGGNVTQTANNGTVYYNLCSFNRMHAQGQIV